MPISQGPLLWCLYSRCNNAHLAVVFFYFVNGYEKRSNLSHNCYKISEVKYKKKKKKIAWLHGVNTTNSTQDGDTPAMFVLRFYGPVNPLGSCRARSVYLTTRLLGRLSPLSG